MNRLVEDKEFPPYAFLPGHNTHPNKPGGHGFEVIEGPVDFKNLFASKDYLFSIDLYNFGYYWESHVGLEALWNSVGRSGIEGDFFKGLIKLGAAGVKGRLKSEKAMIGHLDRAIELFLIVQKKERCAGGLKLEELLLYTEDLKKKSQTFMEIVSDPCLFPPLIPKRENV